MPTPTRLYTLADSMDEHTMVSHFDLQERLFLGGLTPAQRLDYQRHNGDIANCPGCGMLDQYVNWDSHPDMVGTTYVQVFACCGHTISTNDALEYDASGKVVDVR